MTEIAPAKPNQNRIGLTRADYSGSKSTLCTGCGHDSISNNIVSAFYQSNIDPYTVAKMSGIGCSSKTPAYFMSRSFAFNAVHGRMPSVSTGVNLANRSLKLIGISGDGDTASIGVGQFIHMIRRNLDITYVVANNGVYGLTKGQFSATSESGASLKSGEKNPFSEIDICTLAIELGCGFVARSFSGDSKQLVPLISAAMRYRGTSVIDVISPCITFNNQASSLKSYDYVKDHRVNLQELGFIEAHDEITVEYAEGSRVVVDLPDGSHLVLSKIDSRDLDLTDKCAAVQLIEASKTKGEILTGLFRYSARPSLVETLNLVDTPLAQLNEEQLRPSANAMRTAFTDFR
ncbi:MAG: 2-oxoglutarate ferredoxin oxidoreductase subunit beta [Bdellovibrionales bacterium CG10_big_fil_rev_8_21_14_0_10_45_34]|nr:MAG: 2-oxoglutarate ferredoxin oxidoreductase subunit beta [Bdellovibrionales bacterium CG10_big_fil_rev_8_21_14_0_10_45_34]